MCRGLQRGKEMCSHLMETVCPSKHGYAGLNNLKVYRTIQCSFCLRGTVVDLLTHMSDIRKNI